MPFVRALPLKAQFRGTYAGVDKLKLNTDLKKWSSDLFDHWVGGKESQRRFLDAMEVITALIFTSKMARMDKLNLIFDCIDFDQDNDLDVDEVTICFKSIQAGLARSIGEQPLAEEKAERLAIQHFQDCLGLLSFKKRSSNPRKVSRDNFLEYCLHPNFSVLKYLDLYAEAEAESSFDEVVEPSATLKVKWAFQLWLIS